MDGPRRDELGFFGTLISRLGPGLIPPVEEALREQGEGPITDVAQRLEQSRDLRLLQSLTVEDAPRYPMARTPSLGDRRVAGPTSQHSPHPIRDGPTDRDAPDRREGGTARPQPDTQAPTIVSSFIF
jgi:hypothetical protein